MGHGQGHALKILELTCAGKIYAHIAKKYVKLKCCRRLAQDVWVKVQTQALK